MEASLDNLYWAEAVRGSFNDVTNYEQNQHLFVVRRPFRMQFVRFRVLEYLDVAALRVFLPVIPGNMEFDAYVPYLYVYCGIL